MVCLELPFGHSLVVNKPHFDRLLHVVHALLLFRLVRSILFSAYLFHFVVFQRKVEAHYFVDGFPILYNKDCPPVNFMLIAESVDSVRLSVVKNWL